MPLKAWILVVWIHGIKQESHSFRGSWHPGDRWPLWEGYVDKPLKPWGLAYLLHNQRWSKYLLLEAILEVVHSEAALGHTTSALTRRERPKLSESVEVFAAQRVWSYHATQAPRATCCLTRNELHCREAARAKVCLTRRQRHHWTNSVALPLLSGLGSITD